MSIKGGFTRYPTTKVTPEAMVDRMATAGCNAVMYSADTNLAHTIGSSGLTNEAYFKRMRQECTLKGLQLGASFYKMNGAQITLQQKYDIPLNTGGQGDSYIAALVNLVKTVDPDFIDILNEPLGYPAAGGTPTPEWLTTYDAWLIKAIDAVRAVKSNLICVVQNAPYFKLGYITGHPVPRSNVLYAFHEYYQWDGKAPPAYEKWRVAYWNAKTQAELDAAKTLLIDNYDNIRGIKAAQAAGLTIFMEETGAYVTNPNVLVAMKDMLDYCAEHNLSFMLQCNRGDWTDWPAQFNTDGSDSPLSLLWEKYLPGQQPTPPTYQEWIITKTVPQPTQEWKVTVSSQPGRVSGWV